MCHEYFIAVLVEYVMLVESIGLHDCKIYRDAFFSGYFEYAFIVHKNTMNALIPLMHGVYASQCSASFVNGCLPSTREYGSEMDYL